MRVVFWSPKGNLAYFPGNVVINPDVNSQHVFSIVLVTRCETMGVRRFESSPLQLTSLSINKIIRLSACNFHLLKHYAYVLKYSLER